MMVTPFSISSQILPHLPMAFLSLENKQTRIKRKKNLNKSMRQNFYENSIAFVLCRPSAGHRAALEGCFVTQ